MARSKVIDTGTPYCRDLTALARWCEENIRECGRLDEPLSKENAACAAIDIYLWAQEYRKTNHPKITESLCHRAVCELGDWSEK